MTHSFIDLAITQQVFIEQLLYVILFISCIAHLVSSQLLGFSPTVFPLTLFMTATLTCLQSPERAQPSHTCTSSLSYFHAKNALYLLSFQFSVSTTQLVFKITWEIFENTLQVPNLKDLDSVDLQWDLKISYLQQNHRGLR